MRRLRMKLVAGVLTSLAVALSVTAQAEKPAAQSPADTPVEAFAALPSFSGARFSPDGKMMAYLAATGTKQEVVVRPLATSDGAFRIPPPDTTTFRQPRWANNDVLLVQASLTSSRQRFERRTTQTRWFSFDLASKEFIWLGKPKTSQHELPSQLERIIDILPNDKDHILLQLDLNLNGDTEVYKTNVRTGGRRLRRARSGRQARRARRRGVGRVAEAGAIARVHGGRQAAVGE